MLDESKYVISLYKFYTLVMLSEGPKHGYEIQAELAKKIGRKPSASQIYPLLRNLEKKGLVTHELVMIGKKKKKVYTQTNEGRRMSSRLIARFSDIISIALEPQLTKCAHCGISIYGGGHRERIEGKILKFCCIHCAESYKQSLVGG